MIELVVVGILVIVASLILYARWNYGTLEALGIPVVKPHFLLGSTYDFHRRIVVEDDIALFKKYGSFYGVYEGREPQVHVCEAELIKCIMVKDFDYFNDRRHLDFGNALLNEMPDFPPVEKWKAVRQMTTPTFTALKIKNMSVAMGESLQDFVEGINEDVKIGKGKIEKYDMRQAIFTMLTDLIARCAFSIKIDNRKDTNNPFVQIVKRLVEGDGDLSNPSSLLPWSLSFPILKKFTKPIFDGKAADDFAIMFREIIQARRKSGEVKKDYLDEVVQRLDRLNTDEYKKAGISELTVLCQALVFYFAGQDQISSIIAFLLHYVSLDSEIEKKLYAEVDAFVEKHKGKIDHENISELIYVTACINESLRLRPFFIRAERVCCKDYEKDGLKIKKGMTVIIPIWAANRNPEYFPDPEKYDPERFMPYNKEKLHPYALNSFGHGPRNCIGMRFAYEALQLTAIHLLKAFRFKARPETKITCLPGLQFLGHHAPFYMDVVPRETK